MVELELLERARRQHVAGELESAERAYREILDADPNHPDALHLLGVVAHQSGRDEEAVGLLTQATAAKPGFTKAFNNLGSALHRLGRLDEARVAFGRAIALDPDFADVHFNLGVTYQTSKDFDKAILAFERALHIEPGLVDAEVNLGVALRNLERGRRFGGGISPRPGTGARSSSCPPQSRSCASKNGRRRCSRRSIHTSDRAASRARRYLHISRPDIVVAGTQGRSDSPTGAGPPS